MRRFPWGILLCNGYNGIKAGRATHNQNHVCGAVERAVALEQQGRRDGSDAVHAARDRDAHRMFVVQALVHACIGLPEGRILHHADFLIDDALLFGNVRVGKVGGEDKLGQNTKIFLKI